MVYHSPPVGNEISCVFHNVPRNTLLDNKKLTKIILKSLEKDSFTILKESSHEFKPKGFTMMVLLSESHLAIHTYPEHNSLTFNLYSCRSPIDGRKTFEFFKEKIKSKEIDYFERKIKVKKD